MRVEYAYIRGIGGMVRKSEYAIDQRSTKRLHSMHWTVWLNVKLNRPLHAIRWGWGVLHSLSAKRQVCHV